MKNVALFIDIRNFAKSEFKFEMESVLDCIKAHLRENLNLPEKDFKLRFGKSYGSINYGEDGQKPYELYNKGVETIYCPCYRSFDEDGKEKPKSIADPMLICDAMEALYESKDIDLFVIATSDIDFLPLIRKITEKGKDVLVVGIEKQSKQEFIPSCNAVGVHFIDYEEYMQGEKYAIGYMRQK